MPHFSKADIEQLYKISLINSCSGYKSANLIDTKSSKGTSNIAIFSSVSLIGSSPALIGFFLRPTTVIRNPYKNIKKTNYFTINHIYETIIKDAHHTSAKYNSSMSEFDITNLEKSYKGDFFLHHLQKVQLNKSQ